MRYLSYAISMLACSSLVALGVHFYLEFAFWDARTYFGSTLMFMGLEIYRVVAKEIDQKYPSRFP